MKPRTKTVALITQKSNQVNPEINSFKIHNHQQPSIKRIDTHKQNDHQHKKQLSLSRQQQVICVPQEKFKKKVFNMSQSENKQKCSQCIELERQNYRLIESNYNMLVRHASITQKMKQQLQKVIVFIQEYHYVEAIRMIYGLLENIKKYNHTNIGDMDLMKLSKLSDKQRQDIKSNENLSEVAINSLVEQYQPVIKPQGIRNQTQYYIQKPQKIKQLATISNIFNEFYLPQNVRIFDSPIIQLDDNTPHFKSYKQLDHHILWNEDYQDQNDRINASMQSFPNNLNQYKTSHKKHRYASSQNNIKILKSNNHSQKSQIQSSQNIQEMYRILIIQALSLEAIL